SRHMEQSSGGAVQTIAETGSVNKATGKSIKWTPPRTSNGNAQYYAFNVDLKSGTINMIGYTTIDQWYVDDNRAPKKDDRDGDKQPGPGPLPPPKVGPGPTIPVDPLPADPNTPKRNKLVPRVQLELQEKQFVAHEPYVCRELRPEE